MKHPIVLTTASYAGLGAAFTRALRGEVGPVQRDRFPDGERYARIEADVELRDVVLLGGTISDPDTLELFDLGCTAVMEGAQSLTLVVPYFGYSTMERAKRPGEVVTAKTRARLLSAIPRAHSGNAAILLDLHVDGIAYYFGDNLRACQVGARSIMADVVRGLGPDVVVAATDAGRAKWVEALANEVERPAAFVYKRRLSGTETRVTGVNADVAEKTVALYDDMIRTGGTLIQAARAYRQAGAKRVVALATHFLPSEGALERIRESGEIDRIYCTDSHPRSLGHPADYVEVHTIAPLLARAAARESS